MLTKAFCIRRGLSDDAPARLAAGIANQPQMIRSCEALCRPFADVGVPAIAPERKNRSCVYLAVWDANTDEVMAAVPLIDPYPMSARFGVSSEFDSRDLLTTLQGWVLELGDICVAAPYRGKLRILRRLLKALNAHLARMNIAHVITLGRVPRRLGDNTLQAVIDRARASASMPFLPVRPWIVHPTVEPHPSKPPRVPSSIKTWLRAGGIIHPVPSWNACTNMATFLMYMNVAAQPTKSNNARPTLSRVAYDTEGIVEPRTFLARALK